MIFKRSLLHRGSIVKTFDSDSCGDHNLNGMARGRSYSNDYGFINESNGYIFTSSQLRQESSIKMFEVGKLGHGGSPNLIGTAPTTRLYDIALGARFRNT